MSLRVLLVCTFLLAGCGGSKRTYQVVVRNASEIPVTVWLTKTGPPTEPGWAPPELVALQRPGDEDPIGGVIIPPGKTGSTPRMSGKFPDGVDAVLRVYRGDLGMSELLAINPQSPNRVEVVLQPGQNDLVVTERSGLLVVETETEKKDTRR